MVEELEQGLQNAEHRVNAVLVHHFHAITQYASNPNLFNSARNIACAGDAANLLI